VGDQIAPSLVHRRLAPAARSSVGAEAKGARPIHIHTALLWRELVVLLAGSSIIGIAAGSKRRAGFCGPATNKSPLGSRKVHGNKNS